MSAGLPGVSAVQYAGAVSSPLIPSIETNALTVAASSLAMPAVIGASAAQGSYFVRFPSLNMAGPTIG